MILTHFASSALGGYLAGRLRTKWTNIHSDEVYFRDTAHGFLAWSVAVVVTAAFLASAAAAMMGTTSEAKGSSTGINEAQSSLRLPILSTRFSEPTIRSRMQYRFQIEVR